MFLLLIQLFTSKRVGWNRVDPYLKEEGKGQPQSLLDICQFVAIGDGALGTGAGHRDGGGAVGKGDRLLDRLDRKSVV